MIIENNEGTLAERIYCFYAIDHFIGSTAISRIKPTRDKLNIICAMMEQFSNENTLKNHCQNRNLIDLIDLIKLRKGSFRVGGYNFMETRSAENPKLFGDEYTLESESILIYAHHLITGEFQSLGKTHPNDFSWTALFNGSGDDKSE
jgi:hypothetical protein